MAFVNEYVSQEDIEKYGLEELHKKCSEKVGDFNAVYNQLEVGLAQWMIDREKEIWFMKLGIHMIPDNPPIYMGDDMYILHYRGRNIEVVMKNNHNEGSKNVKENPFKKCWDILSFSPKSIDGVKIDELIEMIQEAMESFGDMGVGYHKPYTGVDVDVKVQYLGEN